MTSLVWTRNGTDFIAEGRCGQWKVCLFPTDREVVEIAANELTSIGLPLEIDRSVFLYLNGRFFAPFMTYEEATTDAAWLDEEMS